MLVMSENLCSNHSSVGYVILPLGAIKEDETVNKCLKLNDKKSEGLQVTCH